MKAALPLLASIAMLWACAPDPSDDDPEESETLAPAEATSPAAASEESAADGRISQYTRLDGCDEIRQSDPDKGEGDFSEHSCPGLAGYAIKLSEDDLRQNLWIKPPRGAERSLKLSEVTRSGGFSRIGDRLEWRGTEQDGGFVPETLILRYSVVENPDKPEKETSYLLTVSLAGGRPCVTAKIAPGPNQNHRAREVADRPAICLD